MANPYILASDNSPALLPLLRADPAVASAQDEHGYSLLHAAASYNHLDLLRTLVEEFKVDVNLTDEDGETCLFVAESVEVARYLVEECGINKSKTNDEGLTAAESITNDGSFPLVAAYLNDIIAGDVRAELPSNVKVSFGTRGTEGGEEGEGGVVVDTAMRQRIEELAARGNFHSEEGQRELRGLVADALRGSGPASDPSARDTKRRVG
ncbi:ankyrin repeat-containing protein [Nannizzia gypsea CBS 118893]|uniref:Ankyrin repeat-containing protein n=1 Tax=Arthroderma gypseum (strain ATCC MYA-4604 / CBS 118893) TaxID=535722 RepID=E4V0Y2_ARTGP|nr:ankyrin repeat-containing protein [Nannizzia gypsea CBS 118893]EFR03697.1 ankyrin repeat-containing protein [Nannizzia gypsea CBS 118893]